MAVIEDLVQTRQLLADAAGRAVFALTDTDLVAALDHVHAICASAHLLQSYVLAEINGRGLPAAQGATSTTAWLRGHQRISPTAAARQVHFAKALPTLPALAAAMACGVVNAEQAQVIARAIGELPAGLDPALKADAEAFMVQAAARLDPVQLRTAGAHLLSTIDPDRAEQHEREALERAEKRAARDRYFTLTPLGDGRTRLSGILSEEAAAIVNAAMQPLCRPADPHDQRTLAQRRADALRDICELSMATGLLPGNRGEKTTMTVTVPFDLVDQELGDGLLDTGEKVSAEKVRRMACDAAIIPAVLDGAGMPLDVGRIRRLFQGAIRKALELRDGGCAFPGCDRPPKWCDAHHAISWCKGGKTCLANGVLLCGHHHRLIHQGEWQVYIAADGMPEFIPPAFVDPTRTPRRNHYHRRP
jgi:hypothetical protein